MSVRFECSRSELSSALKMVAIGTAKKKSEKADAVVEIDLQPDKAEFLTLGAKSWVACVANGYAKAFLPFVHLYEIVRKWKGDRMIVELEPGKLTVGSYIYESARVKVVHPENQVRIELPLNYSIIDILNLPDKYSVDDLERLNLVFKVEKAELELDENAQRASYDLSKYGVTKDELLEFIRECMRKKLARKGID